MLAHEPHAPRAQLGIDLLRHAVHPLGLKQQRHQTRAGSKRLRTLQGTDCLHTECTSDLEPAENAFELGPDLFPRRVEIESSSSDAVSLDPDIEVGLSRRVGARIEEETADRAGTVGI